MVYGICTEQVHDYESTTKNASSTDCVLFIFTLII